MQDKKINILLIGSEKDKTYKHTKGRLDLKKIKYDEIDLDEYYYSDISYHDLSKHIIITSTGKKINFNSFSSIYHRIILDEQLFGELSIKLYDKYQLLILFLNNLKSLDVKVINYPSFFDVNSSKIHQTIELNKYFKVPKTLCTNSKNLALKFISSQSETIYKSCSSIRSIVNTYDNQVLDNLKSAPCLFQERIVGFDVRVHVIFDDFFCEKIISEKVDYRYSTNNFHEKIDVPVKIKKKILRYMAENDLEFVGADFKVSYNSWYLLEINTMPGYSGYDERTNYQISEKLISLLNPLT
jgi:glutathione synthase/RimK-type ligase-like ATP-grasp enzyme